MSTKSNSVVSLETDSDNSSEQQNNIKSYDTVYSFNRPAKKISYTPSESLSLSLSLSSLSQEQQDLEQEQQELEQGHKIIKSQVTTDAYTDDKISPQQKQKKSQCCLDPLIPMVGFPVITIFAGIGFFLVLSGVFYKHGEYNKIEAVNYITFKTDEKYCSNYDKCYWLCCGPLKNNSSCPEIASLWPDIDNSSYCERKIKTTNVQGTACGSYPLGSNDNNTESNIFQCCQGGPCQEEKNYWKIKCIYTLSGTKGTVNVNVSFDHLFLNEKSARDSFVCATNTNLIRNETISQLPVYFPTSGYEFNIRPTDDFVNCLYESSSCIYVTNIIFNQTITYSINSSIFYKEYSKTQQSYVTAGVILIMIGCVLTLIIYLIHKTCLHKEWLYKHIFRSSAYKVVPVIQTQKKEDFILYEHKY